MKIIIGRSFSREFNIVEEIVILNELESNLNDYFENLNYGDRIKQIYIGIICVSDGFNTFFPLSDRIKLNSNAMEVEYGVKLDFEHYKSLSKDEKKRYIQSEILKRTEIMLFTKNINGFDKEKFLKDLKIFIKSFSP